MYIPDRQKQAVLDSKGFGLQSRASIWRVHAANVFVVILGSFLKLWHIRVAASKWLYCHYDVNLCCYNLNEWNLTNLRLSHMHQHLRWTPSSLLKSLAHAPETEFRYLNTKVIKVKRSARIQKNHRLSFVALSQYQILNCSLVLSLKPCSSSQSAIRPTFLHLRVWRQQIKEVSSHTWVRHRMPQTHPIWQGFRKHQSFLKADHGCCTILLLK